MKETRDETMLKIGEFARLGQVSVATLRHYDACGLLKPAALDPQTGYRYYTLAQLPRLHRIVALKDLGFALPQIAQLLTEALPLNELETLFQAKQARIQQTIDLEQERLARVAARLEQMKQEGSMPVHEVLLKQVEPLLVATTRQRFFINDDLAPGYERIFSYLERQRIEHYQPVLLLWYSRFEVHDDGVYADLELAVPVRAAPASTEQISVRTLPGGLVASTVHSGQDLSPGRAYAALYRWLTENHYRLIGPPRLLHFQAPALAVFSQAISEIQFPVEKSPA
jgi:DNA-binding transcriptional MerR regulator